ncbi:MAG: prephenate dehydratase domain-containing protein [Desulfobulbus sp.]|jgi:chorismate mutase/prephenate dehydratase
MTRLAVVGTAGSLAWQAARHFDAAKTIHPCADMTALLETFTGGQAEYGLFSVYNTREGERKQHFRFFDRITTGYWVDNVVLYSQISLGVFEETGTVADVRTVVGTKESLSQCEEYIATHLSLATEISVANVNIAIEAIRQGHGAGLAVIDSEENLRSLGLQVLEREIAPYNRTRYAVFGHGLAPASGYDATVFITEPLPDRVGLLVDILGEFSRRGINILDLRTENDVKTQRLRIYLEVEGHIAEKNMSSAIEHIEARVIQQKGALRLLGSFPRVDMRTKHIKTFGFIGTGAMSQWFAERLRGEGYNVLLTGRKSELRPEKMVQQADVVVICVPISATSATVQHYGPLLTQGQALILLAGESEGTIQSALAATDPGVEVMLVHNLWGPKAATMRDKNAIIVRTSRSGVFCSEFESFLYKHGADIFHDSPSKHDLLMGVGQRLPTIISVALAMTLHDNHITSEDIASHCSLTSLYSILAMARVHSQNARTYAEIMATAGDSRKIAWDFAKNLNAVMRLADDSSIAALTEQIDENARNLSAHFLEARMRQATAVDEVLTRML